ncbi:PREDICTED: transcription repressor OFP12-like [Tarenaya hassleriana]|uniref:transcription repressor OFP12-like n=1 Tax=Tarenaya hassleriana TaxID=28532 RepID=UPI00053C3B49|nr:PREDICTED: transcription repressor OFP12-like [Tarenaya hassleriana]
MKNLIPCFTVIKRSMSSDPSPDALGRPSHSAGTRPVFQNFNSLFNAADCNPDPHSDSEPDLAAAIASQRFFFSSPGRSNAIIESSPSISAGSSMSVSPSTSDRHSTAMDGVAVDTYSPDPYADFRRSMEEMVEARGLHDARANWEKLHELLLCYLALNPKNAHSFIVRAFADLLVTLISYSENKSEGG